MKYVLAILALVFSAGCGFNIADADTSGGGLAKCFVDGTSMGGKCTAADPLHSLVTMSTGIFGDGSDGACVFDGSSSVVGTTNPQTGTFYNVRAPYDVYEIYVVNRDLFCSTITISNLVYVDVQGQRIFASTSITLNGNALLGTLAEPGFDGNGANAGVAGCCPGVGGAASSASAIPTHGGNGGNGNTGAGSVGTNAVAPVPIGMSGNAGAGGTGAASGGGGGTGAGTFGASQGDLHGLYACLSARTPSFVSPGSIDAPGGGGGGGDNGTHKGGGGGAGGGMIVVAAPRINTNNTSKLIASGGDGGAGATGGGATGGGGGGHGGLACIAIGGGTQPTTTVAGGAGGAGGSGGATGSSGAAGLVLGPSGGAWVVGVQ